MSIYRLGSDVWENILDYLAAADTVRLLLSGDNTIRSRLKPAIRDFVICLETTKSPRLSSLLDTFKRASANPRRLSISLGEYYQRLLLVSEEYTAENWKTFFPSGPSNLESLELGLSSNNPAISSLFECLAILAPRLKKLCIEDITDSISLPDSLIFLEMGAQSDSEEGFEILDCNNLLNKLPSTLTHSKFPATTFIRSNIEASKLPFAKMPLTVFHGNLILSSLSEEEACWSILPNTIQDLHAQISYGPYGPYFPFPENQLSWKHLFPNLTALNVPLQSFADPSIVEESADALDEAIFEKQIEKIRSSFPSSLTALTVPIGLLNHLNTSPSAIICALGPQLRRCEPTTSIIPPSMLKWLPKWENPRVRLMQTQSESFFTPEELTEDDNFEKFLQKKHPIAQLCRSATSLTTKLLPASAISLLPRSINTLDFQVAENEPISLTSASDALERLKSHTTERANVSIDDYNLELGWKVLGWPPGLTKLKLEFVGPKALHLGCLPASLRELRLIPWPWYSFQFEGGDLAHISELSILWLDTSAVSLITSLQGLPRSLRSLTTRSRAIAEHVFEDPDVENFFFCLENLELTRYQYRPNVLLHLPRTLKRLDVFMGRDGPSLCEKHFEQISRTKLAHLALKGDVIWCETIAVDVFNRLLPNTLASFSLNLHDLKQKVVAKTKVAPLIPTTLLEFYSNLPRLEHPVKVGIP